MIGGVGLGGFHGRWIKHYSSLHTILLVGEGDFSFSLTLGMAFGSATNIVATTLDSYDALIMKYKDARENVEILNALGASLFFGVDATQMKNLPELSWRKFDRIIYNFPHAGFYGKEDNPNLIMKHRNLVRGFLQNASSLLGLNGEIHINHKTNAPFDSWRIEDLALECSLICIGKEDFRMRDYQWYCNKRGSGWKPDEPFPLGSSKTFKFKLNPIAEQNLIRMQNLIPSSSQMLAAPLPSYDVNSSINGLPLHNYSSECHMLFSGYLKYVEETFGSNSFDERHTVEEALRVGFETYMRAVPERPSKGFISILEELHHLSTMRSQRLKLMLSLHDHQL